MRQGPSPRESEPQARGPGRSSQEEDPQPHPESKRALFALSQPFCTFQPPAGDRISWSAYLGSLSIMTTS